MPRTRFEQAQREGRMGTREKGTKKKSFRKRSADAPSWDEIPASILHTLICVCCTHGACPTFSYTRDGTSLVCSIYHDGNRYPDYLAGLAEVEEYLNWVAIDLLELQDDELAEYEFFATERASNAAGAPSEGKPTLMEPIAIPRAPQRRKSTET